MSLVEGGRREATKQANRAAILQAARRVFADLGFGAASVRDIVRRTDLATGTFYNYFDDKEAVFRALVEDAAAQVRLLTRAARREATTTEAFVADGFRAYLSFLVQDREASELLRRNTGTVRAMFDDPAIGQGAVELEADLRWGIAEGLLPDHDAGAMATAMTGAGLELGMRLLEADDRDLEADVAFLRDLFLGGLEQMGRTRDPG